MREGILLSDHGLVLEAAAAGVGTRGPEKQRGRRLPILTFGAVLSVQYADWEKYGDKVGAVNGCRGW